MNWRLECENKRFAKRTIYIQSFYPGGGRNVESRFVSRYRHNIKNTNSKCFLLCLIAYLHPAKDNPKIVRTYNKSEIIMR